MAAAEDRPLLAVIVTSYDSPAVLRECLRSLVDQPEVARIVVADCSPESPADWLAAEFPQVELLRFEAPRRVPAMRWAALELVAEPLVGALESRCVPAPDWATRIVAAHHEQPDCPAAGGPVAQAEPASGFDWGLYFCEYGAFAPPLTEGPAKALSGANLSYKREALIAAADVLAEGRWETFLHDRWRVAGKRLWLCDARITFRNTMSIGTALRQRFHYGRGYAAERVEMEAAASRALYAAFCPLLPALLTWRTARAAFARGLGGRFLRAVGWIALLQTAWAAGECVGYLRGADPQPRIF